MTYSKRAGVIPTIVVGSMVLLTGLLTEPAAAQNGRLNWQASVDGYIRLRIQENKVPVDTLSGRAPQNVRSDIEGILPRRAQAVRLQKVRGRGRVFIKEQPGNRNNFTAVIDIDDSKYAGASDYDIRVTWSGGGGIPGGNGSLAERAYQRGQEDGREDRRRGLSRDYRRHSNRYDFRTEADFARGYNVGYASGSGGSGGGNNNQQAAFERGRASGGNDRRKGLSRSYRRYSYQYNSATERSFERGYNAGYDSAGGSGGTGQGTNNERAYRRGYDAGRNDRQRGNSRNYRRYSTQYDRTTEAAFERGYNDGYDNKRAAPR